MQASTSAMTNLATLLEMHGRHSDVHLSVDDMVPFHTSFAQGVDSLLQQSLKHDPPLPGELEHAIELAEEAVMPLAKQFAHGPMLELRGQGAAVLSEALATAGIPAVQLTVEEVEVLFNRLVALSMGRPAGQEALAGSRELFAAMLLLREFMHHLGFSVVKISHR